MKARKRLGQHFLEPAWVAKLVDAIAPRPDQTFLEIGPGRGALTLALAPHVARLVAVEVDRDLARALRRKVPAHVTIVEGDILDTDLESLLDEAAPARVAGNLPYNLSTPILFRLLAMADQGRRLRDATLMLQREVADRLGASPGSKTWGVLSACQQLRADVEKRFVLPPGAFRPAPKVHSAVVTVRYRPVTPAVADPSAFDALVKAIFTQRRKVLDNALASFAAAHGANAAAALAAAGLDGRRRPETLSIEELVALTRVFLESGPRRGDSA